MHMLIAGTWRGAADGRTEDVRSPFDGRIIDTVPVATVEDARAALDRAEIGAHLQRSTPAHVRVDILLRAAALADERAEDIAQAISAETGKPITEARGEAGRSGNIIRLAAHEGSQLYGSTLPLDANAGTGLDKIGFTLRQPVGIVVAITPFNYPALLVLHKIAPALAAGNAVVLKPARATPLTALKLAECFVDAGLPPEALSVLTGPGSTLGDVLVTDPRVRKVSFTGSTATGTRISSIAGVKKLSLELGASCPVIILPDADLELASSAVAAGGFINAGQVCISVQRVIVDRRVEADFLDALVPKVEAIAVGNPKEADTRLGSLISEEEAIRVHSSIGEARNSGAKVLTGGDRDGAVVTPAVVAGVDPRSPLSRNELFGPAVAVSSATDIETAIAMANDNDYGLGAGIFTSDVAGSIRAMRQIDAGNIHINWTPLWRADLMPYGGLKGSGIGKEGVRSAVNEMTEEKTVVLHGRPW
ncbi:glyceraldehyde-3-phosphate dehydrogenase (NADP+) [Pseudarthrobacter oxydans]|uniref:Glyceraldehyde-3-phosphate dehydrogenase (NADP+) n=1 Tax=Pseudarthrobacter oxydans TaxID=1671 RepID=A0AAW8NBY8_PSEOX|nr:aldehyde dehydrogenase family protein [Pseudarthrobacter oxydans]MDR6793844.1 glyceraldehyde-3-phosphate dehydrogenase (NADP+) [Pseudarthrobacter oxydans]MDR7165097.1 glyceraldehyde-3-phosphate dehydrogenase (NADP+) [Pseudarthrobacter oxydans]